MPSIGPVGSGPVTPSAPNPQPGVYGGIQNHGVQQYLPIMEKRALEKPEQKSIKQGLNQWFPKLGAGYSTPMTELLASPAKSATISALFLGGLGALVGLAFPKKAIAATIAGSIAGAIGAFTGFINRRQQNDNILDLMQRFPEGATKRDMLSDPVYQSDLNRLAMARSNASGGDVLGAVLVGSMLNSSKPYSPRNYPTSMPRISSRR